MSSSTNACEESEKLRIEKLEEQLYDEQYAQLNTELTSQDTQAESEQTGQDSYSLLMDALGTVKLEFENMEKESKLKGERLKELEDENQRLRSLNSTLEESNERSAKSVRKLTKRLSKARKQMKKMEDFRRGIDQMIEFSKELVDLLESERDELKDQLEEYSEKAEDLEKLNNEAVDSMKVLESERDELNTQLEGQSKKLKDYEARLGEYKEEVDRLKGTKDEVIEFSHFWLHEYKQSINGRINILAGSKSEKEAEEFMNLEKEWKKVRDEKHWLNGYKELTNTLSDMFRVMQEMKNDSVPKKELFSKRDELMRLEENFHDFQFVNNVLLGREWVEKEFESRYFLDFEEVIMEVEEMICKS